VLRIVDNVVLFIQNNVMSQSNRNCFFYVFLCIIHFRETISPFSPL